MSELRMLYSNEITEHNYMQYLYSVYCSDQQSIRHYHRHIHQRKVSVALMYRVGQKKVSLIIFAITLFTASQFS